MLGSTVTDGGPMRVAMVVPSLRGGGLERLVRDLVLGLDRDRFTPAVFCVDGLGIYADDLISAGVAVHDCSEPRIRIRGLPLRLLRGLARFRPTILHAHSGTWLPAAVARSILRYPRLVFTDHGRYPPEPWTRAMVERWCSRRTDRLVAVSSSVASYLRDFLSLDDAPIVIENGIDLSVFGTAGANARSRLRREWALADDDFLALSIGRFVPVKDHRTLLAALAKTGRSAPRLRLALAGAGPLEAELREQTRALGLDDRVLFLGFRSDVAACLQAADLFVISSTTEGLPVALLEAMAAGLPTVATAVGGIPDALGDPPAGLLVPAGDPDRLAGALARLAMDPGLAAEMRALAHRRASGYSLDTFVGRHHELYTGTLEQ